MYYALINQGLVEEEGLSTYQISGNQTGTLSKAIYQVTGQLYVQTGESLTIEAGCIFEFMDYYAFNVIGEIQCTGTSSEPIIFRPHSTNDNWGGIRCTDNNGSSDSKGDTGTHQKFIWCEFWDADKSTTWDQWTDSHRSGAHIFLKDIEDFTITDCKFYNAVSVVDGGSILILADTGTRIFERNYFNNCVCGEGAGGALQQAFGSLDIVDCEFIDCEATTYKDLSTTVNTSTDVCDMGEATNLQTGYSLEFGVNPPAPLVMGTKYYAIPSGSNGFQVASTYANAVSETEIDLTTTGTSPTVSYFQDYFGFYCSITITTT